MEEVAHGFPLGHRVGLDTSIMIYYMEGDERFSDVSRLILESIADGTLRAVASTLLMAEFIVLPFRKNRNDLAARYEHTLLTFPNLRIYQVDRHIARTAARIRAHYGFRLPDAIHLATAVQSDADVFITNDRRLQRFTELRVHLLSDFVH